MPQIQLKRVRLAFPDLFKPGRPVNEGDPVKYGGSFIIEIGSENEKIAKAAMVAAAEEVFGANWQNIVRTMEKSKKCLRIGNDNLDKDGNVRNGFADHVYVVARNKAKPAVIGAKAKKADGSWNYLTEADGKPYGGCYVNAKINIKAMKAKDKIPNQIYATLEGVQFVADGEPLGGGGKPAVETMFDVLDDEELDEDDLYDDEDEDEYDGVPLNSFLAPEPEPEDDEDDLYDNEDEDEDEYDDL